MFCVIVDRLLILLGFWDLIVDLKDALISYATANPVTEMLTSKASSRSGAGPAAAIFLGALPSASALWNATGWSRELYLVAETSASTGRLKSYMQAYLFVNDVLVAVEIFLSTFASTWSPTPSSTIVSQSSRVRKYSSMNSMVSSTALFTSSSITGYIPRIITAYRSLVHKWLDNMREQRRDVRPPDLGLVTRDLEAHPCLDVRQLTTKLRLLGVLP